MDIKKIGFGLLVGVLAVFFVMQGAKKSAEFKAEAKAEAQAFLVEIEGYEASKSWYDQRSDMAVDQAYNSSTTTESSGRRTQIVFNADEFMPYYVEKLINMAMNEGRSDLVKNIIKLREEYDIPRPMDM